MDWWTYSEYNRLAKMEYNSPGTLKKEWRKIVEALKTAYVVLTESGTSSRGMTCTTCSLGWPHVDTSGDDQSVMEDGQRLFCDRNQCVVIHKLNVRSKWWVHRTSTIWNVRNVSLRRVKSEEWCQVSATTDIFHVLSCSPDFSLPRTVAYCRGNLGWVFSQGIEFRILIWVLSV